MGRIVAIDYGEKRLGIAISDETKTISSPLPFIPAGDKAQLLNLIKEKEVELIIMGLPKNLQGAETKSTEAAMRFGKWLEKETKLPIKYVDERFTTKEAQHILKGETSRKARTLVDSLVAQRLLDSYLIHKS